MSKAYNTTTATRDALDLALGAANMAHTLAQQAGLPVVRRLELLLVELTEIEKDVQHVERQRGQDAGSQVEPSQAAPSIPIPIANMLVNLHPHERMALDAAVMAPINPTNANDRLACESLFRKGVFRLNRENAFEIEAKYAPWVKRALTPHEILANLPVHLRELLRVMAARGGKAHVPHDGQHEHDYYKLRSDGILVSDGAGDRFRIADPFKDIAA